MESLFLMETMMQEQHFFRSRIDAMINLNDPLAVLATLLPWCQIESAVAVKFERQHRAGQTLESQDMFGATAVLVGAGRRCAGLPKLPIRLMTSLLYQPALAAARHCPSGRSGGFLRLLQAALSAQLTTVTAQRPHACVGTWCLSDLNNGIGSVKKPDFVQSVWAGF